MKRYYHIGPLGAQHEGNLMTLCDRCAFEEKYFTTFATDRPARTCDKCGTKRSGRPHLFPNGENVRLSAIISEPQMAYLQELGRGSQSNGLRWLIQEAMAKSRKEKGNG